MKVLIIIVTYNGEKWIEQCIQSALNSSIPVDIFVVDNGSTDSTLEILKRYGCKIVLTKTDTNLGFGKANNLGLQYAIEKEYDYVYLLNQDAYLEPNTIEEMLNISQKHPEFGVLSPFQMEANKIHLDKNFVRIAFKWQFNSHIAEDLYFSNTNEVYELPIVMAAHWLISKDCLKKVGGFSPTFAHYGEDNNYCDRIYYHGMKVGIVPSARGIHDREYRTESKDKFMYVSAYMGILRVLSNPNQRDLFQKLAYSYAFIFSHYISFAPISCLAKILVRWREVKKNREISKGNGAFLNV